MATVVEQRLGRRRTLRTAERLYYVTNVSDQDDAYLALFTDSTVPTAIGDLLRNADQTEVDEIDTGRYLGRVVYGQPDLVIFPAESFAVSFDISSVTTHITHSRKTVSKWMSQIDKDAEFPELDWGGAINVQQDGTIDGLDTNTGIFAYQVTYQFEEGEITSDYVKTLSRAVGTINDAPFLNWEAGEVMLIRVSGQRRTDNTGNWDVTFGFAISYNAEPDEIVIGDGDADPDTTIPVTTKRGWDFLWVYSEERSKGAGDERVVSHQPVQCNVEQVYRYANYDALGIDPRAGL